MENKFIFKYCLNKVLRKYFILFTFITAINCQKISYNVKNRKKECKKFCMVPKRNSNNFLNLGIIAFLTTTVNSQISPVDNPFIAVKEPLLNQFNVYYDYISSFSDGSYITVWQNDTFFCLGQKRNSDTQILVSNFSINSNISCLSPLVETLVDNTFVVVWLQSNTLNGPIYGRIFYKNTSPKTSEFLITSNGGNPRVSRLGNGNFGVNYQSGNFLYTTLFDQIGNNLTTILQTKDVIAPSEPTSDISFLNSREFVVAYAENGINRTRNFVGKIYTNQGVLTKDPFNVSNTTFFGTIPYYNNIIILENTNFVVSYILQSADPDPICFSILNSNGSLILGDKCTSIFSTFTFGFSGTGLIESNFITVAISDPPGPRKPFVIEFYSNGTERNRFDLSNTSFNVYPSVTKINKLCIIIAWYDVSSFPMTFLFQQKFCSPQPPTFSPTNSPTNFPTNSPTNFPTNSPTNFPTNSPTNFPILSPTTSTFEPTNAPTNFPTNSPTNFPILSPTTSTFEPTNAPTNFPTNSPTNFPILSPTTSTFEPTNAPSNPPNRSLRGGEIVALAVSIPAVSLFCISLCFCALITLRWYFDADRPRRKYGVVGN